MKKTVLEVYPKVFLADKTQTIYAKLEGVTAKDNVMI